MVRIMKLDLLYYLLCCCIGSVFTQATSKQGEVRLNTPVYSSAGNVISGQLQVYSEIGDWRVACATSTAIIRSTTFPQLVCKALGYDNVTSLRYGVRGYGSAQSVEYRSCTKNPSSLADCATIVQNSSTCGIKNYIYVTCSGLTAGPPPTGESSTGEILCRQSRNFMLPRDTNVTLTFRTEDISSQCSTTLSVANGNFLQLLPGGNVLQLPSVTETVVAQPVCSKNYVVVRQKVLPDRPSVTEQVICGGDSGLPASIYISPAAESVNFTYVRKDSTTLSPFRVRLQVKAQLSVDCQLPLISVSLAKLRLSGIDGIDGAWVAEIGHNLTSPTPANCVRNASTSPDADFFAFNFSSSDCQTTSETNNTKLVISNALFLTRTRTMGVIERLERFRLPISCDLQVDPRGANTPVGEDILTPNDTFSQSIGTPYRIVLYHDSLFTSPVAARATLSVNNALYVQLTGSIPRSKQLADMDHLKSCLALRQDPPNSKVLDIESGRLPYQTFDTPNDTVVRNFRFKLPEKTFENGQYQIQCTMEYQILDKKENPARADRQQNDHTLSSSVSGPLYPPSLGRAASTDSESTATKLQFHTSINLH